MTASSGAKKDNVNDENNRTVALEADVSENVEIRSTVYSDVVVVIDSDAGGNGVLNNHFDDVILDETRDDFQSIAPEISVNENVDDDSVYVHPLEASNVLIEPSVAQNNPTGELAEASNEHHGFGGENEDSIATSSLGSEEKTMEEVLLETLSAAFPDYDMDALLASMPNLTLQQIPNWCIDNPTKIPLKKIMNPDPAPPPSSDEDDSDSDIEFDDIADGLLLDRLIKELSRNLKNEISKDNTKSESTVNDAKNILVAVYPNLSEDFLKLAYRKTGYRLCAALIVGFFFSNEISQLVQDSFPQFGNRLWKMVNETQQKSISSMDIFTDDFSIHDENFASSFTTFVRMMNTLTEKYPLILNRLTLIANASTVRVHVPNNVEKFDCSVCCCDYTFKSRIMCGTEDDKAERHSFCRGCVKRVAETAEIPLDKGAIGLKCMYNDCKNTLPYSVIKNCLPKKISEKLCERIMENNIGAAGIKLERCRNCNYGIEMEESKEENKDDDHFGISCAELDNRNKKEKMEKEKERRLNENFFRTCVCGLRYTKSKGCNKMTCSNCGSTQCYLCRTIDNGYDHFCQHPRDPGQLCKCCQKPCTLFLDAYRLDEENAKRILAEYHAD
uniref:RING-type domain-containing protein n=1 Tax=Panagrolaimus davidi TaxID=227884 RepID=A0A914QR68_9BILA